MDTKQFLLKSKEIENMEGEIKTHFLNPNAVRLNKSIGDAVGLNHIGVHMVTVEAGKDSTEYHIHHYEEECVYIISGQGIATIGGDEYLMEKGDFLGLPRKAIAHGIRNDGSEPLVMLVMGQRLAQDVSDYPNINKRLYRSSGNWDLIDLKDMESVSPTLPAEDG